LPDDAAHIARDAEHLPRHPDEWPQAQINKEKDNGKDAKDD
jgi:hypothetical protein